VQDGDLAPSGALLAGASINLETAGDLINSGRIAGRQVVALTAENIKNLGGSVAGKEISVLARTDLKLLGGSFTAENRLSAMAGRNLTVESSTVDLDYRVPGENGSVHRTDISRVAGLYVTGTDGTLLASAGNDLALLAAAIMNANPTAAGPAGGSAATTVLAAGNNLTLGTVSETRDAATSTKKTRWSESASTEVGTRIQTDGDLTLIAGNDLVARAATAQAGGAINANAGRDLSIESGQASTTSDYTRKSSSSGFLSKKTSTTHITSESTTAIASTFSGDSVTLTADRDIAVKGSNVVATNDTTLIATRNLSIEAAAETHNETHFSKTKQSGVFSSGGVGFTLGSRQNSSDQKTDATLAAKSTIGSTDGNVLLLAGEKYRQVGSDVIAPQGDIDIAAKTVDIVEARETSKMVTETKSKQSGFTVAFTSPVITAIQTAQQMASAAKNTSDPRMKALAAASTGLAGYNAYAALEAGQGKTVTLADGTVKENQIPVLNDKGEVADYRDANAADKMGGIGINLSIGGSKSQSKSTQQSDTAAVSNLTAGRDIRIEAGGAGSESDILLQGTNATAARNLTLTVENEIRLLAARNTAEQKSTNNNSSASVGIGFMVGGTQNGFTIQAGVSGGKGKADGQDVSYSNTHVTAGETLTLQSGGDTTMRGAVAKGEKVIAEIGQDLKIESLQDTSTYDSKQKSLGISVSLCIPPFCVGATGSGSVSASNSKVNSDYASVSEQSAIRAGDQGFDVKVTDDTDLKAGAITSTQQAIDEQRNRLSTGTLSISDIANRASASASSSGFNLSSDMLTQGKYGIAKGLIGNALNNAEESESNSGQTRAVISGGAVEITNETRQLALSGKTADQTVASLNRDESNAHGAAERIDYEAMRRQVEAEQAIKAAIASQAVKFSDEAYRKIFIEKHPMYEVVMDKDGNTQFDETGRPILRELSALEKTTLKPGSDGKIRIAPNGIFNDAVAAGTYAVQHSTAQGPQYVIYFPEANNVVSELLVAGYQKFLENDFWGLSNSTSQVKDVMVQYGQSGLHLDGHSRGSMTIGNALESLGSVPNAQGALSNTTINFFGPAYNAQKADNLLDFLQGRQSLPAKQQPATVLQFQNHGADPVGGWIGHNPPTGGTIPEGSSPAREIVRAGTGQPVTTHNCYGRSSERACEGFWQDTGSYPVLIPATALPAQGEQR